VVVVFQGILQLLYVIVLLTLLTSDMDCELRRSKKKVSQLITDLNKFSVLKRNPQIRGVRSK
jgi:hypothetical protein